MLIRYQPLPNSLPPQPRVAAILSSQKNIMALSWHMPISRDPFRYAVAVREENYTYSLVKTYGSFTLNFIPFTHYNQIDQSGRVHGDEVDKLASTELTATNCDPFGNYLIDQSDYIYECTVIDSYKNGDHTIFITDVTAIHINEYDNGYPTLFLGRGEYATTSAHSRVILE